MSFGSALGYPFKSENIPKVLTIILSFLILVSSLVVLGLLFQSSNMRGGLNIVSNLIGLVYGLFVSGYMISAIRSVMDGNETLPAINLGRDLSRGLACMLAGLIYAIPFIVVYVCVFASVIGGMSMSMDNSLRGNSGNTSGLMLCGAGLLILFMTFTIGMSYIVGMVRYAAEDNANALFNFGANFGTVMSNFGTVLGLFLRQLGMGIIYGILMMVLLFAGAGAVLGMASDPNTPIPLVIGLAIGMYIVFLSLALMSQLSSAHLFAGFGRDIGLAGKSKNDVI